MHALPWIMGNGEVILQRTHAHALLSKRDLVGMFWENNDSKRL